MKIVLFILTILAIAVNFQLHTDSDESFNQYLSIIGNERLSKLIDRPDGSYTTILPDTRSMEPCLSVGDVAFINRIYPYNDLRVGDIIVYSPAALMELYNEGKINFTAMIHRIEGIAKEADDTTFYFIKGDNNPVRDRFLLTPNNYQGKVYKIELDMFTKEEFDKLYNLKNILDNEKE